MSRSQLDETGKRLLDLLRNDARRSATSLAKELNLSRTAVQDRISRMERDDTISGYTIIEGHTGTAHVALAFVRIETRPCEPVLGRLRTVYGVERVFSTAGDIDAVLLVRATDATEISSVVDHVSAVQGVGFVKLQIVLSER